MSFEPNLQIKLYTKLYRKIMLLVLFHGSSILLESRINYTFILFKILDVLVKNVFGCMYVYRP